MHKTEKGLITTAFSVLPSFQKRKLSVTPNILERCNLRTQEWPVGSFILVIAWRVRPQGKMGW